MTNENTIWKSKFLGELDKHGPIFENKKSDMQFKIKIISSGPSDFPNEIAKTVTGFSDSLRRYGYLNQIGDDEERKAEKILKTLDNKYVVFSVVENSHSDSNINRKYFNALDIMLVPKDNTNDTSRTFETIPFFSIEKGNIPLFMEKIMNEEYLGKNDSISYHKDDVPPFILIQENQDSLLGEDTEEFYAIGPFVELQHNNEYGVKFLIEDSPKLMKINVRDLVEYYTDYEGVVFLATEDCLKLEEKLQISTEIQLSPKQENIEKEARKIEDIDEEKFLLKFENTCKSKGLIYTKQDLYNFHTAMKTQGFVILAGMSGTGKSQLIQCYYEALYQRQSDENLLFIPVSPSWQDDSDLLGYLDTLNSVYRPGDTGLADFILESNKKPNECFIVCLDEMNLARVEHYFSQFLSILERNLDKRIISLYNSKIEDRIFNKNDYPAELKLGENILFVGTVNTDESTFSFSDKVLDRANVINLTLKNFNEIKQELATYETDKKVEEKLHSADLDEVNNNTFTKFQGMKKQDKKNKLSERELEFLWKLHSLLNDVNPNIGIGMRVLNQIEQYLINLPESNILSRENAIDLQISQRVFTKLRGSEGQLLDLIGIESEGELTNSKILSLFQSYNDISSFKMSIEKLRLISKELAEYGHTI